MNRFLPTDKFQSTLPREERPIPKPTYIVCSGFQSTLPREERPMKRVHETVNQQFQSTLPREERRIMCYTLYTHREISIHAPTRGATPYRRSLPVMWAFQSTLPREERRDKGNILTVVVDISIHAPTRGATGRLVRVLRYITFQSTLPREERQILIFNLNKINHFNPRSHERSDRTLMYVLIIACNFNPRSHERSDADYDCYATEVQFQSTLPREERQQYCTKNLFIFIQYRQ